MLEVHRIVSKEEQLIADLTTALLWCHGGEQFSPGGDDGPAWDAVCEPVIEQALSYLGDLDASI